MAAALHYVIHSRHRAASLLIGDGPQGLTLATSVERLADAIRPETRSFSLSNFSTFTVILSPT